MVAGAPRPFFTAPGAPAPRRFLLVSAAYPPSAEIGALRWQKIAEAARTRGWTIDVIEIDPTDPSLRDPRLLQHVPPGARLYDVPLRDVPIQRAESAVRRAVRSLRGAGNGSPSGATSSGATSSGATQAATVGGGQGRAAQPGAMGQLLRAYRTRVFFAQWNDWASRAAALGASLAQDVAYDAILSSGPPHFAHDAARLIAEASGRPLVIDLRDPWFSDDVEPPAMRGATWRALTAADERRAVDAASLVVVNTDSCRALMVDRYPARASHIITIMNGADADVQPAGALGETFVISHTGSLYSGRDPRILFRAVATVVQRLALAPSDLHIHFMGDDVYEGQPLESLAADCGVGDFTVVESRRPRAEALALIQSSAMVVLLPQQHLHSIPGKVFEYVQLAAWPLVIADAGTATELLLRDTGADVLAPHDVEGVAGAIERRYLAFRAGERPTPINADGRFDRARQTSLLLDALDTLA